MTNKSYSTRKNCAINGSNKPGRKARRKTGKEELTAHEKAKVALVDTAMTLLDVKRELVEKVKQSNVSENCELRLRSDISKLAVDIDALVKIMKRRYW